MFFAWVHLFSCSESENGPHGIGTSDRVHVHRVHVHEFMFSSCSVHVQFMWVHVLDPIKFADVGFGTSTSDSKDSVVDLNKGSSSERQPTSFFSLLPSSISQAPLISFSISQASSIFLRLAIFLARKFPLLHVHPLRFVAPLPLRRVCAWFSSFPFVFFLIIVRMLLLGSLWAINNQTKNWIKSNECVLTAFVSTHQ